MLLRRVFDHDRWATDQLLAFCAGLDDDVLDGPPLTGGEWSVRQVLVHLVQAQRGYAGLLGLREASSAAEAPEFDRLATEAEDSGRALADLATSAGALPDEPIRTDDGFAFAPWIVAVQVVHHATEHRRQVATELRARGLQPPRLDVWAYGHAVGDLQTPEGRDLAD